MLKNGRLVKFNMAVKERVDDGHRRRITPPLGIIKILGAVSGLLLSWCLVDLDANGFCHVQKCRKFIR